MNEAYPELVIIVQAWSKLPAAIRVAILKLVQAMAPEFIRSEV